MNKSLFLLLVLLLTGCAPFQVSTLNHDPIYSIEGSDAEITVIDNEFELQRLLRTDFNFRFDFAQYALRQPRSFDWNNRLLGNRYSFYNPYYSRTQMWNDWVWGYNWHSPYRWSPFGYNNYGMGWSYSWNNRRWSSNQWGNPYGWNNRYGWNNGFYNRYRGTNVAYHNSRRSSNNVVVGRRSSNNVVVSNRTNVIKDRIIVNRNKPRLVVDKDVVIDKALIKLKRNNNNIRVYQNPNNVPNNIIIRNNNNNSKPVRNYNRPENNSRPNRTYSPPSRSSSPPVISRPPTRSSNPPVISRGSGGSKPVIKR